MNHTSPTGISTTGWDGHESRLPIWEPIRPPPSAMPPEILDAMGEARCFMTAIQLQALLDRTTTTDEIAAIDMDMTTDQQGNKASKFNFKAIKIGKHVPESIKRAFELFNQDYLGKDSVFPTENGAPRIMTQFEGAPYSLELLDQYTQGPKPKKLLSIKGVFYNHKPATSHSKSDGAFRAGYACCGKM